MFPRIVPALLQPRRCAIFAALVSALALTAVAPVAAQDDTPRASGPSCTTKQPCIVLKRKGLSRQRNGRYLDPDATVKVIIARDAHGNPARVVAVELRKVDSRCSHYDETSGKWSVTPGPEVSVDIAPFAVKKYGEVHANYNDAVFRSDPRVLFRTINGIQYRTLFYWQPDARDAEFSMENESEDSPGTCPFAVSGPLKRITTAAERAAVAECKELPARTTRQRRKRANCLEKARY